MENATENNDGTITVTNNMEVDGTVLNTTIILQFLTVLGTDK